MSKIIVAIGGGENGRLKPNGTRYPYELENQDKEIIRLTGKVNPNFLLIAHAQPIERQEEYFQAMVDIYQKKYGENQPLISMECLGFIDGLFVPHCDTPGRLESVKELLKVSNQIGLAMSNCTALEIIDDKYRLITSNASYHNIEAYGLRVYWKNEKYIEEKLDTSETLKPLNQLLEKI